MADEINTNKPNVGIRGNPASTPILKSTEKIQPHGNIPNFVSAFDALATTPTALGQLNTQMMTSATNQLMDHWGYELGSNPHGNLLPAITDADKRLAQAYTNQANATLSLKANQMMLDGQTELSKANRLTPDLIHTYQNNMAKGLSDILEDAPDTIKSQLSYDMGSSLMRSTAQINNKMITQQKQEYKDNMMAFSSLQTKNIYEAGMAGNSDEAQRLYESQIVLNKKLKDEGVLSATQEATSNQTAKQTLLTGIYTQRAIDAKKNGTLESFLTDMANAKEKDVSYLDWQAVQHNVLGNLGQIDRLESRDQALMSAQFDLAITEHRVTGDEIEELKSKVSPESFIRSMIRYKTSLNTKNEVQDRQAQLASQWGSTVAQSDATSKDNNATFQALSRDYAEANGVSLIEAKIHTQQASGIAIPQFTDELNNMMQSGNPDLMIQAKSAYSLLGPFKAPLSAHALKYMYSFDSQIAQGKQPLEAAQIVQEVMKNTSQDQLSALDNQWKQYRKEHLNDFDAQTRFAKRLLDIPSGARTPSIYAINQTANKAFETNLMLTKGDVSAALNMTRDNLSQSYGVTYANGSKEFTYLPLEKFTLVDKDHMGIIQNDAALQVESQLVPTKEAYDKGHSDFYYRIKRRGSVEEAIKTKQDLDKYFHGRGIGHLGESEIREELQNKIKHYTDNKPIEIEKVWRHDTPEVFEMVINSNQNIGLGINSSTPIDGAYSISIRSRRNGGITPIIGIDNASDGQVYYQPNIQKLNEQTLALLGLTDNSQDLQAAKERYLALAKSKIEPTYNVPLL